MDYPPEFSSRARARVEVERLKAGKDLEQYRNQPGARPRRRRTSGPYGALWREEEEEDLHEYILRVSLAFAYESCELGLQGVWTVDRIRSEVSDFLRKFTIEAHSEKGHDKSGHPLREMVSNWDGSLLPKVHREFQKSAEWHQFEKKLLSVAQRQAEAPRAVTGGKSADAALTIGTDRRAIVEAFLLNSKQETPLKVTKTHIWRAVGHKSPRQFQYWQAGQDRLPGKSGGATQEDNKNFSRILAMEVGDLVALLKKKGIA
jgi:hypothetical protein